MRLKKFRFGVLFFLLLIVGIYVRAERLPIKIYTSADGLGSSASFKLVRDSRGFIWLCSRDGLIRFDGYRFITYRIGNDEADPAVYDLIPTNNGIYWINLNRGMDYRFVSKSDDVLLEPVQQSPSKNDSHVPLKVEPLGDSPLPTFVDSSGNMWNANDKGIHLMREIDGRMTSELIPLNLPENPAKKLTRAIFTNGHDGSLWVGTNWGLVRRLPNGKLIHTNLNPQDNSDTVLYFGEDKGGRIWVARTDGLIVFKPEALDNIKELNDLTSQKAVLKKGIIDSNGQVRIPEKEGEAYSFSFADILRRKTEAANSQTTFKPEFYGLICASDGKVWITSNQGLIVFDGTKFMLYTTQHGLSSNTVASLIEDNEGNIWITSYGGLHRINPYGLITYDETDGVEKERIHSIYEDKNGNLQIVSGNFNIGSLQNGVFKTVRPALPYDAVWTWQSNAAFLDSHGDWWVNTNNNLYRFTGIKRIEDLANKNPADIYNSSNGLINDSNVRVFEDSKSNIWISTFPNGNRQGLTRWERTTGKFEHYFTENGLPQIASASAFAEDSAGNLWFGFLEGGIARFRNGRFTILDEKDGMPIGTITAIHRDKSGRMWVASSRGGLTRVDNPLDEHPTYKRYSIADGLTSNNIRCITEDLYGNIYLGTVRGVNRLSPETGHIKYYGTSDGLVSDFVSVAYRDRSGAIWFGTFNGLSKLIPEPDKQSQPPTVLISGLRIAGTDYSVSPLGQKSVIVPDQSADRNNLQIDFLSTGTGGSSSIRYKYKLDGASADWSQITSERSVNFANLSPGTYKFLVLAINADDVESSEPAVVTFTVLRPIWQRWWFLSAVALLIAIAAYSFYRYRLSQLLKLERVRTRIATDLHDDIGSSLSQIAILSEVVRQKVGDKTNGTSEPLNLIADKSREMVDSMSDIVWAINPHKDNLGDLVHRMHRFAGDMLEGKDIDYSFTMPEEHQDISLGADVRREVYLMFKECINNLVKHSEATSAEVVIKLERDYLTVKIQDNGRGFDVENQSNGNSSGFGGNGLKNMSRRTKNLGGEFLIDSKKGEGTRITIKIPVSKRIFATR